MSSNNYPKLSAKLDEILCEFEEILRDKISKDEIEEVRLSISEENFVPRSPETNIVLALVDSLKSLKVANKRTTDKKIKTEVDEIKKKHVLAARSLLKIQSHQELATRVLIAAIESSDDEISETATKALGEFSDSSIAFKVNDYPSIENETSFFEKARIDGIVRNVTIVPGPEQGSLEERQIVNYHGKRYVCNNYDTKNKIYYTCNELLD